MLVASIPRQQPDVASGGWECNDPAEASSSKARAQTWCKLAADEAEESQLEAIKEKMSSSDQEGQESQPL